MNLGRRSRDANRKRSAGDPLRESDSVQSGSVPECESGPSKYDDIVNHLVSIFGENREEMSDYRLYVTGHSLGGALSTLFSFHLATAVAVAKQKFNDGAVINNSITVIPTPITCVTF